MVPACTHNMDMLIPRIPTLIHASYRMMEDRRQKRWKTEQMEDRRDGRQKRKTEDRRQKTEEMEDRRQKTEDGRDGQLPCVAIAHPTPAKT